MLSRFRTILRALAHASAKCPAPVRALGGLLCAAVLAMAGTSPAGAATPLANINSSSKYLQYYGNDFTTASLDRIAQFDVVVLQPNVGNITPASVAYLKSHGVKYVLGYISVGEDDDATVVVGNGDGPVYYDTSTGTKVKSGSSSSYASFYVDQQYNSGTGLYDSDTLPDTNGVFGGRYVVPNSDWQWVIKYQRIGGSVQLPSRSRAGLDQIAGTRVSSTDTNRNNNFGFDGFFLDTVDTAGPYSGVGSYPWMAQDMSLCIKFIHDTYPNSVVFANRGVFYFNPLLVNATFNVRPYDYCIRPYIHAGLFESYYMDSANSGVSPYFTNNKYEYAPKITNEANRPDGFTQFCLDYMKYTSDWVNFYPHSDAQKAQALVEATETNGWIEFEAQDGTITSTSMYVINNPPPTDTAAPAWNSTGGQGTTAPTARVGVRSASLGPNQGDVTLAFDMAFDQTPPVKYNVYRAGNSSFTSATKYAGVPFEVNDGYATSALTTPANKYTVTGLAPGTYYFRIRAEDSAATVHEDTNTTYVSITVPNNPAAANPVGNSAITLNGSLTDWASLGTYGTDPQDATGGSDQLDWKSLSIANDATYFYIAYTIYGTVNYNAAFNTYIDTDSKRTTGFRSGSDTFSIGAEYLIQGAGVYKYTGTGTNWSWSYVGAVAYSYSGGILETSVAGSLLGSPTHLRVLLLGDNAVYGGSTTDYFPDSANTSTGSYLAYQVADISNTATGLAVDGNVNDWLNKIAFGQDPQDITGASNPLDWKQAWLANDSTNFYLTYQGHGAATLNWGYGTYIDSDVTTSTGYRGSIGDFPLGADYLLQGTALYQYTGSGTNWSWSSAGSASSSASGANVELSFAKSLIGSPTLLRLFLYGDNAAYSGGSAVDYFPDNTAGPIRRVFYYRPN
jgi:hypothetical protein